MTDREEMLSWVQAQLVRGKAAHARHIADPGGRLLIENNLNKLERIKRLLEGPEIIAEEADRPRRVAEMADRLWGLYIRRVHPPGSNYHPLSDASPEIQRIWTAIAEDAVP